MLRYLRENTGNWIIKFFLGIIVIVFVFLGVGSFGSKRNDSIATINDEVITINEYQQAYKGIVDQMRARFGKNLNNDILKALNVKQQALDSLIEKKLILIEADKLNIDISDKELQQSLLSIKAFQKDGKFNLNQYKRVLSLNSLTPETFELGQIESLRQRKVRDMVLNTIIVSDMEAENWYLFQNTKIAVNYLLFSPGDYKDIHPNDEQISRFYEENKNKYKSDAKAKAVYLKFSPEDYKADVMISDIDIKDYYQENLNEFKTAQKVEARHILIKVAEDADSKTVKDAEDRAQKVYEMAMKGQDFQELAKQFSEGPSKENGGYLGIFEKQSMVKPFADTAFSMDTNDISKPVRTKFGWHIIKVISKIEASTKTLAQASEKIKKTLEQQELQNLAYDKAGEAFDAVIDGDDFEQVALITDKKITKTKAFSITGEGLDIKDKREFAEAAFKLSADNISDVEQIGNSYYLIKVIEKIDPVIQDLNLVKELVTEDLTRKLQNEQARENAQKSLVEIVKAKNMDQYVKENAKNLKTSKLFTRNGRVEGVGNSPDFIQASFTLNQNNKIYPEIVEIPAGFCVIGFKELKTPDESEIEKNLKTVRNEINWKKQAQSYQAWIRELKRQSQISYDPEMLN